jgi:hypothetical protein
VTLALWLCMGFGATIYVCNRVGRYARRHVRGAARQGRRYQRHAHTAHRKAKRVQQHWSSRCPGCGGAKSRNAKRCMRCWRRNEKSRLNSARRTRR